MNISKEFLAALTPPLPELLPKGAIGRLAELHDLNRVSVGQMLRGEYGSDEKLSGLYQSALDMMQANIEIIERKRSEWLASQRVAAGGQE